MESREKRRVRYLLVYQLLCCSHLLPSACDARDLLNLLLHHIIQELLLTTSLIRYQTPEVMKDVMTAHIELFGKTIHERVRSETSGKYKKVLLALLNTVWPEEG